MANFTKQAIKAAFLELLDEKPLNKISVRDIVERCGINRNSFYYHFQDKYDLVNWIFYVGFIGEMDLNSYTTGWDWLRDICGYFYRERDFYRCALKIEGQNSFKGYLIETVWPIADFFMQDIFPEGDEEFFITFVIDALLTSIIRWLSGGYDSREHRIDADEYMIKIREIVHRIAKTDELKYTKLISHS